jgi:flagellar biosynthesis anti-sigma factor FlgM
MKIGKPSEIQRVSDFALRSGHASGGSGQPGRPGAAEHCAADGVRLSRASGSLRSGASGAEATASADRIENIRTAIEERRFPVNAEVIADRMISEAAQLLETLGRAR